jgi:hypothetical protein
MTNLEAVIAVLVTHREARRWTDQAVAIDLLAQLGLEVGGDAAHATPLVDPGITEDEVVAAEKVAQEAFDKAKAARAALDAAKAKTNPGADQAKVVVAQPLPGGPAAHDVETRHYGDGTSATGKPPLPDLSPAQQSAAHLAAANDAADQVKVAPAPPLTTEPAFIPPAARGDTMPAPIPPMMPPESFPQVASAEHAFVPPIPPLTPVEPGQLMPAEPIPQHP